MSRLQKDSTVPSVASTSQEYQENRTLKVTLLSSEWRSSTDGDFSTINRELAIQLAKQPNVDVSVFLPNCSGEDRSSAENHNVKLIEADRVPGLDPVLWLSFPPRNHTMDCVISYGVHLGQLIPLIKRNLNSHCKWIQVVYSAPEGGMYKNISEGEKMLKTEIALCRMADQVITIGPELGEAYKHHLLPVKHKVDVFELTPSILSEFLEVEQALGEGTTFSILLCETHDSCEDFIGKGYDIAAEAIAMLKDKSYKLKVVCPAGGKGNILEEKLLHHGICRSQLIFYGFYDSREALADLFYKVDLAIMPSRTKSFGITALGALSAGLPVLVSDNSGLGEALMDVPSGPRSVVYSEDPGDWAKGIKQVRQTTRRQRLEESSSLRTYYLERYSWEELCKNLVIKMRNLVFGESVICNLQQQQQYVSRSKISSNTDVLKMIASEKGYRVSDNLGSGNCMFYALSEQLEMVKRVKIHHFELRRSLVQYLREHPKMVDGTDLFHFVKGHAMWGGYLTDMEQDGTWGDHVILWAAANCYQIAIHVISSLPGLIKVIIKPDVPFDQSKHLVLGHVHELHYVSLQPLQGYDQELADFYASLQPSSTGSGRPQSSGSTEVKQEEDSGSAAQKHKFDPIGEPETSGVSSSSKSRKFEGYDQELADFYASLQPSSTGSGRPQFPMEGVISQLLDVKMEPDTVQHLELKKDLLRDVKVIKRYVIFRGEVTEKGNVWNLPEAAAYVTFHEGAVPKPLLFTCSVWPPTLRSPPLSSDELLVSNVIELLHDGPPELELSGDDKGNVTVALLHSASDLKGYEVVIKQLVDPYDNVWKDLETWHASEIPDVSDWPQLVKATCTLSQCSSFAAIWRLKSFTFTSRTSVAPQFTCVVPDFSDICVEVPLSSVPVDQDFTLTIKVQEFPSNEVEDFGIWCGPVIHISSSQNIVHMEPVTIKVPLTLRESKHDFSELSNEVIRILYLDSEGKPWNASWTDITGQLEGPVTIKGGIVEFKVKHFCRFCVCMLNGSPVLLEDYFRGLSLRPMLQCVHFHTCLCKTTVPDTYGLLLYCYPNFKQAEVEKKLLSYDIPYKGEGKSKEPACVGDEFVVSPSALDFVRESPRNETVVLRFLGNEISEICDEALIVRTDSKIVPTVKFFKDKALQKLLCEVMILKTRPASLVQVPVTVDLDPRFASCSTEVKQEEESGSAAKKLKLVTSVEPETSRVSSANKTRKFKVSDVKKEERDGEDGHKGRKSKETAIQGIKKISFVGKKRAREESDQKAVHPSTPMRDQDRISPHNISEIPAKKPRTQPNKRMSSKDNTGKGTCAQIVNNEKGKASKPRDSKKKVKQGKPTRKELMGLGRDIGDKWRILGGCLEVEEELESIDERYKSLTEKGFHMLKYWTQKNGSSATYRVLSGALEDELLARKDLSEKYCYG